MIQTLFIFLTSIKVIHLWQDFYLSLITYSGNRTSLHPFPQILSSPLGSLPLYLSLTVNPFFTSTKSATPFPPSPLCNNRPSSSHFSVFLCMIHFQAKLNASLTVSPLDWTFVTTFSYGNCYWFDFFFLSPFLVLGFLVFCFCSSWLLCCVAQLKFMCEGVGRIREKGFWP